MGEKSYVAMVTPVCPVCCRETGEQGHILLDRRLKDSFDSRGYQEISEHLCGDCQQHIDQGKVALVEADPAKSKNEEFSGGSYGRIKPQDAYRTGRLFFVSRPFFEKITDVPLSEPPVAFIEPQVGDLLGKYLEELESRMSQEGDDDQSG